MGSFLIFLCGQNTLLYLKTIARAIVNFFLKTWQQLHLNKNWFWWTRVKSVCSRDAGRKEFFLHLNNMILQGLLIVAPLHKLIGTWRLQELIAAACACVVLYTLQTEWYVTPQDMFWQGCTRVYRNRKAKNCSFLRVCRSEHQCQGSQSAKRILLLCILLTSALAHPPCVVYDISYVCAQCGYQILSR